MKLLLDVFAGDRQVNHLMHCADVFEAGKQLADYNQIEIDIALDIPKDISASDFLGKLKLAYEQAGKNVVFMNIIQTDGVKTNEFLPYMMEGVQTISTGNKFGMFHKILTQLGYEVETNERMMVTAAKLKI
jgi:hypothetical protein